MKKREAKESVLEWRDVRKTQLIIVGFENGRETRAKEYNF